MRSFDAMFQRAVLRLLVLAAVVDFTAAAGLLADFCTDFFAAGAGFAGASALSNAGTFFLLAVLRGFAGAATLATS